MFFSVQFEWHFLINTNDLCLISTWMNKRCRRLKSVHCYSPALQRHATENPRRTTEPPQKLWGFRSSTGSPSDRWQSSSHSLRWITPPTAWWWPEAASGQRVPLWGPRLRRGCPRCLLRLLHCCPLTPTYQVTAESQRQCYNKGKRNVLWMFYNIQTL